MIRQDNHDTWKDNISIGSAQISGAVVTSNLTIPIQQKINWNPSEYEIKIIDLEKGEIELNNINAK